MKKAINRNLINIIKLSLLFTPLSFASFANAEIKIPEYCSYASSQSQMNECSELEYKKADEKLNKLYHEIMQRTLSQPRARLMMKKSQQAWVEYKTRECILRSSQGGTIAPMLKNDCEKELTIERNKILEHYLNCPEGDLSCPF